jgi:hypothetical protein
MAIQASSRLNLVTSTWDVFNFTVVEAMHSGRPVVCSSCAGASELIEDGVTGFVYEGTSPTALADALKRALAAPERTLIDMGAAARATIAERLDPDRIAMERISAYNAAIKGFTPGAKTIPDWVRQISEPRDAGVNHASFLERQPLRELASHVGARVLRKFGLPS